MTFELSNGQRLRCSAMAVEEAGGVELLRRAGYGHLLPTERVPVMQCGKRVGSLPPDFDSMRIKSLSFLYDPRPGDFVRDGDAWVASKMLGPGDFEMVPGFRREAANSTPKE